MKEILILGGLLIAYFLIFGKKTESPTQEEPKDEKPNLKIRKKNA